MIPSRPLEIGDLFGQVFSLFGRTFTRYTLFFLIVFLPGAALVTYSSIGLIQTGVRVLQHHTGFNDQDLAVLRNRLREQLYRDNPALRGQFQELQGYDSVRQDNDSLHRGITNMQGSVSITASDSVQQKLNERRPLHFSYIVRMYASEFVSEITLFFLGCVLLFAGLSALNGGTTELACQAFEERELRFGEALRDTLGKHLWSILGLLLIWFVGSIALSVLRSLFDSVAVSVGSFFFLLITAFELFIVVRFSLSIPAIVSERLGPIRGLARSWDLTAGYWWRTLGLLVGFGLLIGAVSILTFVISSIFMAGSAFIWWKDFLQAPIVTIPGFLNGMSGFLESLAIIFSIPLFLLFPFASIFTTLLYYDLRTRKEGPLTYSDPGTDPLPTPMWQP